MHPQDPRLRLQIHTGHHTFTAEQPVPEDIRTVLDEVRRQAGD